MSSCQVKGGVTGLDIMVDPALDNVHLLVTTHSSQWRILVEQRSTGYVWGGCEDTCPSIAPVSRVAGHETAEESGAVQRTRLQSIKQMSVDRIANLRNKLAEGRRLLKSRSECEGVEGGQARLECVSSDLNSVTWSVQRDGTKQYYLSGNNILTMLTTPS